MTSTTSSLRSPLVAALAAASLAVAFAAAAQPPASAPPADPFPTPAPELDRLSTLAGRWDLELELHRPRRGEWTRLEAEPSDVAAELRGRTVRQVLTVTFPGIPRPVRMELVYTFDRFQGLYRVVILDDWAGLADVFEGGFDGDRLVFDNTRSKTYFGPDRVAARFSFRFVGPDLIEVGQEASGDEGRTWTPLYRGTLRRRA